MTPAIFAILLTLVNNDLYGYAILKDVEELTNGGIRLTPGTLYRSLQRMWTMGLIEEIRHDGFQVREPPDAVPAGHDSSSTPRAGRRRVYRITPAGRAAVDEEARRLARLVRAAHLIGILEESSSGNVGRLSV